MTITNARQYRIARAQLARFEEAAKQASESALEPILQSALYDQALSQAEELREEIEDYEALAGSGSLTFEIHSIAQFPQALIHARIAAGLTQQELADQLGVTKQQVHRDEQIGYAQVSLERLVKIAGTLGVTLNGTITISPDFSIAEAGADDTAHSSSVQEVDHPYIESVAPRR